MKYNYHIKDIIIRNILSILSIVTKKLGIYFLSKISFLFIYLISFAVFSDDSLIVSPTTDFSSAERFEARQGGSGTFYGSISQNAFSTPAANMSREARLDFRFGNDLFKRLWVAAPSSTPFGGGLGPLYNARACQECHIKDGRGHPPNGNWPDDNAISMVMRLSIPPSNREEELLLETHRQNVISDPVYGVQLQDFAIPGLIAEGLISIDYEEIEVVLADGTVIFLRNPTYIIEELGYGPLSEEIMTSPRIAPPMIGLGLLEAIAPADILGHADPDDLNGDGISGRANIVWSEELNSHAIGRFGWKAGEPNLNQQNSHAFSIDIGLSTPLSPFARGDCAPVQSDCLSASGGGNEVVVEVTAEIMEKLLFYTRNLAVPPRRAINDLDVLAGKRLFYEANCIGCHVPKFITPLNEAQPEQSDQLIWPYTDLLLHDMGEGLSDERPEGLATGFEWRTPPLWGIGLTEIVSDHTFFLHDGRARNLTEAILWHGGEAQKSRDNFAAMTAEERGHLIAFLRSL